jgi:prepilin-type N-terminal cleavage/methylation domain-containing protein
MHPQQKAFTLIELLIVVAIIAILAAIAVPNFLEAQVRAKVSRQLNNMRTTATALEAYYVDNNHYPYTTHAPINPPSGSWLAQERWKIYPGYENRAAGLTTPIAYITGADAMEDIFRLPLNFASPLANQIMYLPSHFYKLPYQNTPTTYAAQVNRYGLWVMRSAGPDSYYQNVYPERFDYGTGPSGWNRASYDPTNGTVSGGDIYRSQKRPDETHALK